jgi:manganese/zinc/iron transport system permease protein
MATMTGVVFGIVLLIAPSQGLIALALRRMRQKWEFAQTMLAIHLFQHEGLPEAEIECRADHLQAHLRWPPDFASRVVKMATAHDLVVREKEYLRLTDRGRELAAKAMVR